MAFSTPCLKNKRTESPLTASTKDCAIDFTFSFKFTFNFTFIFNRTIRLHHPLRLKQSLNRRQR